MMNSGEVRMTCKCKLGIRGKMIRIGLVCLLVFGAAHFIYLGTSSRAASQAQSDSVRQKQTVFQNIVSLHSAQFQTSLSEWTYWDEMVDFVKKPDPAWMSDNLGGPSSKLHLSRVYVFDRKWNQVYEGHMSDSPGVPSSDLAQQLWTKLGKGKPFASYFLWHDGHLIEVRGACIHKGDDEQRQKDYYGFLVATRTWDQPAILTEIGGLTESRVEVSSAPKGEDSASPVVTLQPKGPDGQPQATITFRTGDDKVLGAVQTARQAGGLFGLIGLACSVLAMLLMFRWTVLPMVELGRALRFHDPSLAEKHSCARGEVGELARAVLEVQDQRIELEAMNNDLAAAHDHLAQKSVELETLNHNLEEKVAERTQELAHAVEATMRGWSRAMEARDRDTEGHTQRVTRMAERLGEALGLDPQMMTTLTYGAMLHDIGKIGIPDAILHKEGALTAEEFEIMKQHPVLAYDMLESVPFLAACLDVPLHHHEKWDGTGYPYGLQGNEIPLLARIFALADVWDALRSDRPYRKSWTEGQVREYIAAASGTHFDPTLVEVFLSLEAMPHPSDRIPEDLDRAA